MAFCREDIKIHLAQATDHLMTLQAQGPNPSWDFPQSEMDARMARIEWHLGQARSIMEFLEAKAMEVPSGEA